MRGNTNVVWAARNVGDSNDSGQIHEGSVNVMLRWMIRYMGEVTLARRIDIAVGRTYDEVYKRIMSERANKAIEEDELLAEVEALMNREPDEEDDYQGPSA